TTTLSSTLANSDILLCTEPNNLAGAVSVAGTASNIRDFALRNVYAAATVPTLSTLTNLRYLTLTFNASAMALPTFTASGTATITAGGAITQAGAATVTGASSFPAG